jgi:uncharacterized membrane protein YgaE (UPF0421/DUF939 family)
MNIQKTFIKTGTSVFIAIALSKLLKLKYPFFVALPVIMPVKDMFSFALKSGKNRAFGTVIGAIIGVIFVLIKPESAILCGIGIFIIMYICNLFKFSQAEPIAGIVFISIMVSLKGEDPYHYSFNRVLDTFIGICITITINYLITSVDNKNKIINDIDKFQIEFLNYIKEMVCFYNFTNLNNLNSKITNIDEQLNKSIDEFKAKSKNTPKLDIAKNTLNIYKNTYEHLKMISSLENIYCLDKTNYENLILIYKDDTINLGQCLNTEINTVFNYHVSKIIENINKTNQNLIKL